MTRLSSPYKLKAMIISGSNTIYESIASYFRRMIDHGALKPGDALPSVRDVALSEKVNPNTVARAFSLLVDEGCVVAIPKKGYFVAEKQEADRPLRKALSELLRLGYKKEEIINELNAMEADE